MDIEFPAGQLPGIYNAVEIQREGQEPLTCEVQQHLGNNWVRAVAMTTTDGLARGVDVHDTGGPISVPVGEPTLGRVFDVLGHPIDGRAPVDAEVLLPIHRDPPAFDQLDLGRAGRNRAGRGGSAEGPRRYRALAVDRVTEHVEHAAERGLADRTVIGAPVSWTSTPRASPSVVVIATARTQLLPRCCWTSQTSGSWPSRWISTAL